MNNLHAHNADDQAPDTSLLTTEQMQARIEALEQENAVLRKTWENPRVIDYLARIDELTRLLNAMNDRLLETTHTNQTLNTLSVEAWERVGVPRLASITTSQGQLEYYMDLAQEIAEENQRLAKRLVSVEDLQAILESSADLVHRFGGKLTRRGTWAKVNEELDELKEAINFLGAYSDESTKQDVARELLDCIVVLGGMVAEAGVTWEDIAPAVAYTLEKNQTKTAMTHRWDETTKTVVRLTKDVQP